ncbi:hypothetical protein Pmar_PMAR006541, partial [Perkinsus marinus ATCC 50983]
FTFIHDIVSSMGLLPQSVLISLIYCERLLRCCGFRLTVRSWKSIILGSLVIACKMWDDVPVRNHDFAE